MKHYFNVDQIKTLISEPQIQLVSFDIFDTLLVRPSMKPTDIFYLLDDLRVDLTGHSFSEIRCNAESEMQMHDAHLSDIWDWIAQKEDMSQEEKQTFMDAEIALERDLLQVRHDVYEVCMYALSIGKRVIAVSDMYLPQDVLRDILDQKGYDAIAEVYVSCEYGKRKDSGELYDMVLTEEGIADASKMVHIGDNYFSDFKVPTQRGICAVYYPSIWEMLFESESAWKSHFPDMNVSDDPMMRILFSAAVLMQYRASGLENAGRFFASREAFARLLLFPYVFSAMMNIRKNAEIQKGYDKIYFAARDGYLPQKIYDLINFGGGIPSEYLYISRRAVSSVIFKGLIETLKSRDLQSWSYSLGEYLEANIIDGFVRERIIGILTPEEKKIDIRFENERAIEVLTKHEALFTEYFEEQRRLTQAYYQGVFLGKEKREIIFDCGYSGSVSKGLTKACWEEKKFDKIYLWQTEKNKKYDREMGTRTFCNSERDVPLALNLIVEECFSSLEGTCLGFVDDGNGIKPCMEEFAADDEMRQVLEELQRICIESTKSLLQMFQRYIEKPCVTFKDTDLFERIAEAAFFESPYRELALFDAIRFPDTACRAENLSLSYKTGQAYYVNDRFRNVYAGTGFEDPDVWGKRPEGTVQADLKVGLHIHLYNMHLYEEIIGYLRDFPVPFDLFITVVNERHQKMAQRVFTPRMAPMIGKVNVLCVANRGRDVAPWLVSLKEYQAAYDLFGHIHSKESIQYEGDFGERWRRYLYNNLIRRDTVVDIVNLFAEKKRLGCVFPPIFSDLRSLCIDGKIRQEGEFGEEEMINCCLRKMGMQPIILPLELLFSEGTMLWYRPQALQPLFDLNLTIEDFPEEPIGVGGTIAHAIERLPALVASRCGYDVKMYARYDDSKPRKLEPGAGEVGSEQVMEPVPYDRLGIVNAARIVKQNLIIYVRKKMKKEVSIKQDEERVETKYAEMGVVNGVKILCMNLLEFLKKRFQI